MDEDVEEEEDDNEVAIDSGYQSEVDSGNSDNKKGLEIATGELRIDELEDEEEEEVSKFPSDDVDLGPLATG